MHVGLQPILNTEMSRAFWTQKCKLQKQLLAVYNKRQSTLVPQIGHICCPILNGNHLLNALYAN